MTDTLDVIRVLRHYGWELGLPRRGWVSVKCGAHGDSHASCRLNNDIGRVMCLACGFPRDGQSGDAIDIIRYYEGISGFVDAVKRYEEITGGSSGVLRPSGGRSDAVSRRQGPDRRGRSTTPDRVRGGASRGA